MYTQTVTVTGDGTTTQFPFPHGLGTTPTPYFSFGDADTKAISADYGNFDLTADATNVTLDFGTNPPASGVVLTYNLCAA
jgi:hypothetical protein